MSEAVFGIGLALKNGETIELAPLYWVSHCKSLLKSPPEAEILEGPPGVSVAVKEAMVLPQECGNRVAGGILTVTAKDIEGPSYSRMTVRVTYRTRDGDRQVSLVYTSRLFPRSVACRGADSAQATAPSDHDCASSLALQR